MDLKKYESALQYGATIGADDLASSAVTTAKINASAVTTAKIAASAVTGAKSSLNFHFPILVATVNGATASNVFNAATAPVAGTITGFFVSSAGSTGSAVLWATTAGSIAFIGFSATIGAMAGTNILNAGVVAGDTVEVRNQTGIGSFTAYVSFKTAS